MTEAVVSGGWRRNLRSHLVDIYILALVGIAVLAASFALRVPAYHHGWQIGTIPLALAYMATGSYYVQIRAGRESYAFQLDDIPRMLGLFFATGSSLVIGRFVGILLALTVIRRQDLRRCVFNLANFTIEVSVSILIFHLLAPSPPAIGPTVWVAAVVATLAGGLVSSPTVAVALGLATGEWNLRHYRTAAYITGFTSVFAAILGLVCVTIMWSNLSSSWLLVAVGAQGFLGYNSYAELRRHNRTLTVLQDFLSTLEPLQADDRAFHAALTSVRRQLEVEVASMWQPRMTPAPGATDAWERISVGDSAEDPNELVPLVTRAWQGSKMVSDWPLGRRLGLRRLVPGPQKSAQHLAIPVRVQDKNLGVLLVGPPLHAATLGREQARTLEMFAAQLGQALHRGEQQATLHFAAAHDALTGLLTLSEFRSAGGAVIAQSRAALLLIDILRLRELNDVLGREAGDIALRTLAERLAKAVPEDSVISRVGGHHFAALVPLAPGSVLQQMAPRIKESMERPVAFEEEADNGQQRLDLATELGVSIGIALSPMHGNDVDTLLRRAEAAVDKAKSNPEAISVFERAHERDSARTLRLVADLRQALSEPDPEARGLHLVYQPKVCLLTGDVLGVEALARWNHAELGAIRPDEFIPLAESSGLIAPLTRFVLRSSLRDTGRWTPKSGSVGVAVNLSPLDLTPGLPTDVERILRQHGKPAALVTLELTEGSVMDQPSRSIALLSRLKDVGVRLSIDDFGTGYSSLAYLHRLPMDEVKIDRSFVQALSAEAMNDPRTGREFLRQTIALAHTRGLHVVVEGVEDETTLATLRELGADAAQGYHICPPQNSETIRLWLKARKIAADGDLAAQA
jgi:diguanylate cyclase (GGDEF)-like protein